MSIIEEALRKLDAGRPEGRRMGVYLPVPVTANRSKPAHVRLLLTGSTAALAAVLLVWAFTPERARALALDALGVSGGSFASLPRFHLSTSWTSEPAKASADTDAAPLTAAVASSPSPAMSAPEPAIAVASDTTAANAQSVQPSTPDSAAAASATAAATAPIQPPKVALAPPVPTASTPAAPLAAPLASAPIPKPPGPISLGWHGAPWVSQGAATLQEGDLSSAMQIWATGLGKLPADYPVLPLPASISRAAAVTLYRSLSDKYPAILVVDNTSGTPAWQVMLVPEKQELSGLLAEVRTALRSKTLGTMPAAEWRRLAASGAAQQLAVAPPGAAALAPKGTGLSAPLPQPSLVPIAASSSTAALIPAALPAAVAKPGVSNPASNSTDSDPDPGRNVQASASSSAEAILRRFATVERLIAQGKFEAALEGAAQVETEVGETWQTRYFKGTAAKGLRRWDEAVQALTRANQLNPSSTKVLLDRAICQQELGNHEAALDDLRRARSLSPNMPELTLNAGYSFDALERREDAMREYKKFLDMTATRDEYAKTRAWVARRVTR